VFKGTYRHRLDGKGRIPIPAAFRRSLATERVKSLVATLVDQCVAIYPASEWQKLEDQLRSLPTFHRQAKALSRNLASRAVDCTLDGQGRILLPPALRAAAGLQQEAVVVGVIERIEVWSPGAWEDFLRDSERLLEDVSLGVAWPMPGRGPETGGGGPGSTGKL
jgi:transcriptional regulator MraZ